MKLIELLAHAASRLRRNKAPLSQSDPQRDRRIAARALRDRLSEHLRRDIGADDR